MTGGPIFDGTIHLSLRASFAPAGTAADGAGGRGLRKRPGEGVGAPFTCPFALSLRAWVSFEACRKLGAPVTVDGNLADWTGQPFAELKDRGQILPPDPWVNWTGPDDLSAKVYTGWDADNFYFAAEVKDDLQFNQNPPPTIWNGDGFQLAFDPLADAGGFDSQPQGYDPDDSDLGIALTGKGVAVGQWAGTRQVWGEGQYAVVRNAAEKTTRYEFSIPLKALGITPRAGTVFGFSFVLFDDDTGTGVTYYWPWAPGITGGKTPALFRKVALIDE